MKPFRRDADDWGGLDKPAFQHTHAGPEVLPHKSNKNTKRWCKGKVGREHDYAERRLTTCWGTHGKAGYTEVWTTMCNACGKHKANEYRYPFGTWRSVL